MTYQHTTRAPRSMPRSSTPQQLTRDPLLTVSSTDYPGAAVIHVAGEIDLGTAPTLSTYLSTQWENSNRPPVLVLHLADVSFMSCAGLRALLATQDEATAHETELRLVNCPPAVLRLLQLPNLHHPFQLYPTLTEALPWLDPGTDRPPRGPER